MGYKNDYGGFNVNVMDNVIVSLSTRQCNGIEVEPVKPVKKRRGRKKKTAAAGKS